MTSLIEGFGNKRSKTVPFPLMRKVAIATIVVTQKTMCGFIASLDTHCRSCVEESKKMGLWAGNGDLIAAYQRRQSKLREAFGVPRQ
jgi:hypothetical protein